MTIAAELRAIRFDLAGLLGRVDTLLTSLQPEPDVRTVDVVAMDRTKAIEFVLAGAGGPMRPVAIWAELRRLGRNDPKMEVQVTTFSLWQRGRIDKIDRGQYIAKRLGADSAQ